MSKNQIDYEKGLTFEKVWATIQKLSEKYDAILERKAQEGQKAEAERRKADEKRQKTEDERRKAEDERQKAADERLKKT
ncbi:MAG: hypothetical protein LBE12_20160 [Planctomycetaceae bacterium]|nr:hypothetical protein [Planctomycetaceae bacterium]